MRGTVTQAAEVESESAVSLSRAAEGSAFRAAPVRVLHVISSLGRQPRTGGTEYGLIKLVNALDSQVIASAICSGCFVNPRIADLLDDDVRLFTSMEHAVERDRHKMTAFVRFRRVGAG